MKELLETARMLVNAGRPVQAAVICRKVLNVQNDCGEAIQLLGIIEQQSGNANLAKQLFSKLLLLEPDNPQAWSNCGVACLSLGEQANALQCFENAVQLSPRYADAWNNLGSYFNSQGNHTRAEECFLRAISLTPNLFEAHNNLALICKKQQRYSEAISFYMKSLDYHPEQAKVLARLAELQEQTSDTNASRESYRRSLDLQPDDVIRIKLETVLPVIIPSSDSIYQQRDDLWNSIQRLRTQRLHIDLIGENARTLFFLAYHGKNDLPFHKAMCLLYRESAPVLTWQAPHISAKKKTNNRIRVGFISRFFYNHTIAKLTIGYIENLDRSRFHVSVMVIDTGISDDMLVRFQSAADDFVYLGGGLERMREQIAERELDILLYTDIGMEPWSYLLAFARLAPVQCVTWGHPATSGIDTIDYFISHQDCETSESRAAYTEKLFCLSSAATCTCYAKPQIVSSGKTMESFGIDPERTVYYCPQTLFKIHPDFDVAIAKILERDPKALIVLLRGGVPQIELLLRERFQRVSPDINDRIQFLDPLPFGDYVAMLEQADVVLDTFHFSGGNSSVEGFAVGAPIVTLPSAYLKGRLTYAWYQRLGINDCIASTPEEYVDIAVRLGTDQQARENLRVRIRQASAQLFDDQHSVRELEAFFERVCIR